MQDALLFAQQPPTNAQMLAMASVVSAAGAALIIAAIKDWDWVFNSRKYRLWVNLFGRNGCRFVLGGVGAAIILFMVVRLTLDWQ